MAGWLKSKQDAGDDIEKYRIRLTAPILADTHGTALLT
jgi:hypothetical protein